MIHRYVLIVGRYSQLIKSGCRKIYKVTNFQCIRMFLIKQCEFVFLNECHWATELLPSLVGSTRPPGAQSPFARRQVLPPALWCPAPHQRALPLLLRSYRLMRQTKSLPPALVQPPPVGLCRFSPVPAGRWSFPTLYLQSLRRCLDP